jgi:hypothetical protein
MGFSPILDAISFVVVVDKYIEHSFIYLIRPL